MARGWHGDTERHREIGRKGGQVHSREHMQELGRKGGAAISAREGHMAEIGRKGGKSVSQNREHMAEIGRKGGLRGRGVQLTDGPESAGQVAASVTAHDEGEKDGTSGS